MRFSDVGWTDVTATTALITQLLRSIGYTPTVTVIQTVGAKGYDGFLLARVQGARHDRE